MPCHRGPPERSLLEEVRRRVDRLVLVDDGMARAPAADLARVARASGAEVVRVPDGRRGKGHALAAGLAHVRSGGGAGDAVLAIDSDGQHAPESIPDLVARARSHELVIGDRFGDLAAMPVDRRVANRLASRILSARTRAAVSDSQCGMRLLRGRALWSVPFTGGGFEAETRHLKRCLRAGVGVAWVPIPTRYEGSRSSFRRVSDSLRVLAALLA